MVYKKGMKIVKVRWTLESSNKSLLPVLPLRAEYESLLTDFHKAESIPVNGKSDAQLLILDNAGEKPSILSAGDTTIAKGDFSELTKNTRDLRYSLFGNEGLVYRRTLKLLEDNCGIFSFHACAMYDSSAKRLHLIIGSAGSGKTCFMLKGIQMGFQLFTAEMAHFSITDGTLEFYKGALVDNIRIGNLKYNYPFILDRIKMKLPKTDNEWGKKIALDMNNFQTKADTLVNPEVVVILPRVEEGRKSHFFNLEKDYQKMSRVLYENASEKIGQSVLLYEAIPFVALDTPDSAFCRTRAIKALLAHKSVKKVFSVLSGPEDVWKNIAE
jgi:hypothetical protein